MICFKVDGARVSLLLRFHPKVGRLGFRHSHVGDCHTWSVKLNAIILTMTIMLMMTTTTMMILTMMIARVNAVPRYGSQRGYAASKGWLPVSIIDITIYTTTIITITIFTITTTIDLILNIYFLSVFFSGWRDQLIAIRTSTLSYRSLCVASNLVFMQCLGSHSYCSRHLHR